LGLRQLPQLLRRLVRLLDHAANTIGQRGACVFRTVLDGRPDRNQNVVVLNLGNNLPRN
jgi:hypothetical protein